MLQNPVTFFKITTTAWHRVMQGMAVVREMEKVPCDREDFPVMPIVITKVLCPNGIGKISHCMQRKPSIDFWGCG